MRPLIGLGLFALLACAPPKTPIGDAPQPAEAAGLDAISPTAPSCAPGTSIVYRRPLDAEAELEVVFTCEGDRVGATSVAIPYPKPTLDSEEGSEEAEEGYEATFGTLDVKRFNALRRAITGHIRDGACRPTDRHTATMIGVGTAKWRITCAYGPGWRKLSQRLESALEASFDPVDPRELTDTPDELLWPFESDYWKDELGYYRHGTQP